MFWKLLKHELKSQSRILLLLSGIMLGVSVLGGVLVWVLMNQFDPMMASDDFMPVAFMILSMLFLILLIIMLSVYVYAVTILLIYRFYKRHFSDEGYLTFTLPVSTHQLLFSSGVCMLIWQIISQIVFFIGYAMIYGAFFVGMGSATGLTAAEWNIVWESMSELMSEMFLHGSTWLYIPLYIFAMITSSLSSIVLPMTSFTIGATLSKKHKLLVGIGIYVAMNMVITTATSFVSVFSIFSDMAISVSTAMPSMYITLLVTGLMGLAITVGGYFLTHHLMTKKLNLP